MMNKGLTWLRLTLILVVSICFTSALYAQRTVSGKVTSKEEPSGAPSVTVQVKGTTTGTITDIEGNYKITVPNDQAVLVFSFIGFSNQEILVGSQSVINVELKADDKQLQEVVVVGYGTMLKRETTGSMERIKAADIAGNPTPSFDNALQGRAAGLQITQSNGVPGSATRIRVRGGGAIGAGGNPLIVVDGIPLPEGGDFSNNGGPNQSQNTNFLANLNPNDIESIDVLKDASAGAIYGARAAGGVILITTKKGKAGKTSFNLNYSTGVSDVTRRLPLLNGTEWLQLYNEARANDGRYGTAGSAANLVNGAPLLVDGIPMKPLGPNEFVAGIRAGDAARNNTNWYDETLQTGSVHNFDLSAQGGNEKTRFVINGSYLNQGSILKPGSFERISGRVNIDNQATEKLSLGVMLSLSSTKNIMPPTSFNGGIGSAQSSALPITPVRDSDGTYYGERNFNVDNNPAAIVNQNKYTTNAITTLASVFAEYKIKPYLSWRSQVNASILNQTENYYYSPKTRFFNIPGRGMSGLGKLDQRNVSNINWVTSHYLTFDKNIGTDHHLNVVGGFELQDNTSRFNGYGTKGSAGFRDNYYTDVVNADTYIDYEAPGLGLQDQYNTMDFYRFASFFMRASYKFKDKYLFGLTARYDGSSRFGQNNTYGFFPSVSAGWILSEEAFLKNSTKISFLKLRASYGRVGNAQVGNFAWLGSTTGAGAYMNQPGIRYSRLPNPDLSWEKKDMLDISVDYGFFNNRITGSVSFYNNTTSAVIIRRPVQGSSGFDRIIVNDANVRFRDRGVEFSVSSKNVVAKKEGGFEWTTDFNISHNSNVVTNTDGIPPDGFGDSPGDTRIIEGQPIGISYLAKSAGVDPQTGLELIYNLQGEKIQATQSSMTANRQAVGSPNPNFFGGINNTIRFKGFDLSFLFSFTQGNMIYDDAAKFQIGGIGQNLWNQRREVLNRWQKPGDITNVPRLSTQTGGFPGYNTDRWLYDASFIRLRTLMLGYNLPKTLLSKIKLSTARVYVSGQNLLLLTDFPGWDPEVTRTARNNEEGNIASNAPYLSTPQARTFMFGLNIGF
jgi:TonB-linked SusC/RagA family outer membrane protein